MMKLLFSHIDEQRDVSSAPSPSTKPKSKSVNIIVMY